MSKWIAEFELEDGDKMPEHMDLEYHGVKLDFHCRPLEQKPCEDAVSRKSVIAIIQNHWWNCRDIDKLVNKLPSVTPQEPILDKIYADIQKLRGCSCSCSDGIIDDIEDILDKYKAESEE